MHSVTDRRTDGQTDDSAVIPGPTGSGRRVTRPTGTALFRHQSPGGAFRQALYRRSRAFPVAAPRIWKGRPARGDDVSSVVDVIPSASQDMALQSGLLIRFPRTPPPLSAFSLEFRTLWVPGVHTTPQITPPHVAGIPPFEPLSV